MNFKDEFNRIFDTGNYEEAYAYLQKFSGYAYEDPFYFANMGWLYNHFRDYENAKSCLLTGLRVFDQDGWMLAQLGYTYNRCMEYAQAQGCLLQALEIGFDEPWLHYELYLSYQGQDHLSQALEELQNVLLEIPDHCGYLEECGDLLMNMNRYEESYEMYEKAYLLTQEPYDQLMMAQSLEKRGQFEEALALYEKTDGDDEALHRDVLLHSGICLYELSRPQEALKKLQEAQRLGRDDTMLYQYLGRVWQCLGEEEKAQACYERALAYYERALDNYDDRRWLYQEMFETAALLQDHHTLYKLLAQGMELYGDEPWMRYWAAQVYSDDEQYERSIEILRACGEEGCSEEMEYLLAHDLGRANRHSEALAVLEKLHQAHPQDTWVLREYGWNLVVEGHYEQAIDKFAAACALEADAYCEAMQGWCLYQMDQAASAIPHLQRAAALGMRDDWVKELESDCQSAAASWEH